MFLMYVCGINDNRFREMKNTIIRVYYNFDRRSKFIRILCRINYEL